MKLVPKLPENRLNLETMLGFMLPGVSVGQKPKLHNFVVIGIRRRERRQMMGANAM